MRDPGPVQLGLAGMPRRLYSCTPSRLGSWLDCPRRYRMTYLDRPAPPKGPPWAHNSLGASIHNALAGWWRLPPAARTVSAAGTLLERGWIDEGFRDDAQSAAWRRRARDMVERYTATLDPNDEPVGVERTVATRTERLAVSGRIDRLDLRRGTDAIDDGRVTDGDEGVIASDGGAAGDRGAGGARGAGDDAELVVVDYKTGRHVLTTDDARGSLALALYALAAGRVLRRPCSRVELHHLPTGAVIAWDHTEEALRRHLGRAEDIAEECASADERFRAGLSVERLDGVFPPRPGPRCGWCDFSRHCPEGRAAAPPQQPWAGLAEELS